MFEALPSRESDSEAEAAAAEENTLPRPEAELEDEYQDRGAGDTDTDSSHVRQYSSRTWPRGEIFDDRPKIFAANLKYLSTSAVHLRLSTLPPVARSWSVMVRLRVRQV